jgi:DNA-binding transcriptional regulator YhcF (GntR family)
MSNKYLMQRGWMDSPVFAQEPFTEREAYQWMIESAAWKDCRVRCGKYILDVQRGQFAVSVRFIAERLGWHRAKVERFLTKLKTETLIETDARQGLTIITICNYNDSQDFNVNQNSQTETLTEEAPRQYRDSTETNKNTILTPYNTKKEDPPIVPQGEKLLFPDPVIEKPPKEKKPRATQMPQGWKPHDAHRAKCAAAGLNPEDLAEKFENHHKAKGSLFFDWDRAFFTWIGNAKEFNQNHRGSNNENHRKPNGKAPTIDGETGEIINDQPAGNSFGHNPKRDQGLDKAQRIYAGAMQLYESQIRK